MSISLSNIISELELLRGQADRKYTEYVIDKKMTVYTKASKLAVLDELLRCAYQARANHHADLVKQFEKLPTV